MKQRADGAYTRAGTMPRQLHEATAGHPLAGDQDCVSHGDAGLFNTICQDGLPVAFIDWTGCGPGMRRRCPHCDDDTAGAADLS